MRSLVDALCSPACAGRAPGTPGGRLARQLVFEALRNEGLDPFEQEVPGCRGANVLATLPGTVDRWVVVAAHHDHLGTSGRGYFPGADDNAAAVAILVETASALARGPRDGRGVIVAAFDGEEPPHFLSEGMGSRHFTRHPTVPLDRIDTMICLDLVGHALGPEEAPAAVRGSLFAIGAETGEGNAAIVDSLVPEDTQLTIRRADADVVPPLSDYEPFASRGIPHIFLTGGRSARYHTQQDTPEHLDYDKMRATSRWLGRLVQTIAHRPPTPIAHLRHARDDRATIASIDGLLASLEHLSPETAAARAMLRVLEAELSPQGRLPHHARMMLVRMVQEIEARLL